MGRYLFAWTAPGNLYPPYVNFTEDPSDGSVIISVRSEGEPHGEGLKVGGFAAIRLPAEVFLELKDAL
jgi:hypothetical protein